MSVPSRWRLAQPIGGIRINPFAATSRKGGRGSFTGGPAAITGAGGGGAVGGGIGGAIVEGATWTPCVGAAGGSDPCGGSDPSTGCDPCGGVVAGGGAMEATRGWGSGGAAAPGGGGGGAGGATVGRGAGRDAVWLNICGAGAADPGGGSGAVGENATVPVGAAGVGAAATGAGVGAGVAAGTGAASGTEAGGAPGITRKAVSVKTPWPSSGLTRRNSLPTRAPK